MIGGRFGVLKQFRVDLSPSHAVRFPIALYLAIRYLLDERPASSYARFFRRPIDP